MYFLDNSNTWKVSNTNNVIFSVKIQMRPRCKIYFDSTSGANIQLEDIWMIIRIDKWNVTHSRFIESQDLNNCSLDVFSRILLDISGNWSLVVGEALLNFPLLGFFVPLEIWINLIFTNTTVSTVLFFKSGLQRWCFSSCDDTWIFAVFKSTFQTDWSTGILPIWNYTHMNLAYRNFARRKLEHRKSAHGNMPAEIYL